ncbi:MAG: phosphoadenylyl-sulfate reductase [Pseudomonadota bacterium]
MRPEIDTVALDVRANHARAMLADMFLDQAFGPAALVSSFGAEAAVLLHMVSEVAPDAPVIFVDTQMLFQETLDYQLELTQRFGLKDVRRVTPDSVAVRRNDIFGRLHLKDTDACCALRKTAPLAGALSGFDAWVTGRKRHQTGDRADMKLIEATDGKIKVNPLAHWSRGDTQSYFARHELPRHPLVETGFRSIGCAPCTSPVAAHEDDRAGRWRGSHKDECGIHIVDGRIVRTAA